jgi:membrane protease YdiL (CAAX protease family)
VSSIAREVGLVYLVISLVTLLVTYTPSETMQNYGHLILSATFLFGALHMARKHGGAAHYGIDLAGVLEAHPEEHGLLHTLQRALPSLFKELGVALLVSLLIFPPFIPAFMYWHGVNQPFTLQLPESPWDFVLHQLIVVALPEEALFRGYFHTRLADLYPRSWQILGVRVSPGALLMQAVLFALLHFLVGFSPARLAVFFPALVFGLLRCVRGGIGAAIWFHAFSNILSEVLTRGFL